jgi:hypothetical protein
MKSILKTISIFLPIFALTFFLSSFALNKFADAQSLTVTENDQNVIAQRLAMELQRIDSLDNRIHDRLFNSQIFKSLEDFSRPLPEETRGRENPFAPF